MNEDVRVHNWRRVHADGAEWEVRVVTEPSTAGDSERDILEFRAVGEIRPPRRVASERDALERISDEELATLYRAARPIGGDHYGRPGKKMGDVGS